MGPEFNIMKLIMDHCITEILLPETGSQEWKEGYILRTSLSSYF